jgi:hypothetical protein
MLRGWAVGTNTWSLLVSTTFLLTLILVSVLLTSCTITLVAYNVFPSRMKSAFCLLIAASTKREFSLSFSYRDSFETNSAFESGGITLRCGSYPFDEDVSRAESNSTFGCLSKCSKLAAFASASILFLTPLTCYKISSLLPLLWCVILRDSYMSLAYFFMM